MSPICRCGSALYRRLSELEDEREIDGFGGRDWSTASARCRTRCKHLLTTVVIKALCRRANVAKIDAGPKGAVIAFRDDRFANPEGLIAYHPRARPRRQGAPRHEAGVLRRLGRAGGPA